MKALLIEPKSSGLLLGLLAIFSLILIMAVVEDGGYFALFSSLPFILLSICSFFVKGHIRHYGFIGAAIGAIIAIGFPFIYLAYISASYGGGGADLGAGFAIMLLPVFSAIASIIGWSLGKSRLIDVSNA